MAAGTASNSGELDPALAFLRQLWVLGHALERRSKSMERTLGVSGPQRLALRLVGLNPGIALGALADALCVHPSTLTGIVHRLEEAGLLRREPDPRDRRRAFLWLTTEGAVIDQVSVGTVEAAVREALSDVPRDQVATAMAVIGEVARALDPDQPGRGSPPAEVPGRATASPASIPRD